jgi:hypothetical protein
MKKERAVLYIPANFDNGNGGGYEYIQSHGNLDFEDSGKGGGGAGPVL